jgi:hypothetical protein
MSDTIPSTTEFLGLQAQGIQHQVNRIYREGGAFQWVRETLMNALEAGATRVEFGVEWQAVENKQVYRRMIADDGKGMTPDQLQAFFRTFGGGGKPIGGVHENYGVGSKTSLLPWNPAGIVVISWVDGEAAMIWLHRHPTTGEYGLRVFPAIDDETGEERKGCVVTPFLDDEHGCDWSKVKPDWIQDHGTVIVLLGETPESSTILGDPDRAENDIKGISAYLNRRIWEIPKGVQIAVVEMMTSERNKWPRSLSEAGVRGQGQREGVFGAQTRSIEGARHFIEYPGFAKGRVKSSGTVVLQNGTEVDWFLWDGERPAVQSYASLGGYVATRYRNELYDVSAHHSTYRSFGLTEKGVRARVWFVLRPPEFDEVSGRHGIYPRTDRNGLLIQGGRDAGKPLPIADWAAEFAERMPEPVLEAIREARAGSSGEIQDENWRKRLADRFGKLWKIAKLRLDPKGTQLLDPTQVGTTPRKPSVPRLPRKRIPSSGGGGGTGGSRNTGTAAGSQQASERRVAGGIPTYRTVKAGDIEEGMMAAWQPNDPQCPEGVVLLNIEHPVLESEIRRWQDQYPDHLADQIGKEVVQVFGELAVAKVAHSEQLKSVLPSEIVEKSLRSESALTMALLGLMGTEALLADRLSGKFRRKAS